MGSGGRSAEFENPGDTVSGYLIDEPGEAQQQTFGPNPEPKVYRNGQPAMMTVLRLQTDEHTDGDDDGIRILCVADLSKRQDAVARAIRGAGASDIAVGGWLSVTYTGDGVPAQKGNRPPKLYAAQYRPPQQSSGLMGEQQQAPVQQQQYAQNQGPAPDFAQPQAQPQMDQAAIAAALRNLGIDPSTLGQ